MDNSSYANPCFRELAAGESQTYLQANYVSGAISLVVILKFMTARDGGNIVNNPKWQ
jgi:hypothetical protein